MDGVSTLNIVMLLLLFLSKLTLKSVMFLFDKNVCIFVKSIKEIVHY